jgi:tetratricopeptide (TPR) repeat protein
VATEAIVVDLFVAGLVGWLVQEVGTAALRRLGDPVERALERVIRQAVPRAVAQVYADTDQQEHTVALLLESPARELPGGDGVPLARLDAAVRVWVAGIEYPVDEHGRPPRIQSHPLVGPLCIEILGGIREEATRGEGTLHPLWSEYCQAASKSEILERIAVVHQTMDDLRHRLAGAPTPKDRPERIRYWNPPIAHAARFVGREQELTRLSTPDETGMLRLVHGIGGVGKTALVLEHARRVAEQYPDGQVFLDFQSYSENPSYRPLSAEQALAELLARCGLDDSMIAAMDLQQRTTAWRQAIAGRRMLFVWDNVGNLGQIEPLLNGQPGCLALVTSRSELDLPAVSLPLRPLSDPDGVALFTAIAGDASCDENPELVAEAVQLCAWMPLQITVHASSLRRKRTLAELVAELGKLPASGRLSRLFASLDLSYRDLTEGGQRTLRALGTHPGPHLTAGTAAAMLDCPADEAVRLLDELVDANLADRYRGRFDRYRGGVEIPSEPGFYAYVTHDLLRDYAYDKAMGQPAEQLSAVFRLLDHYWERVDPDAEVDRAWLQMERMCLVSALSMTVPTESVTELARRVGHQLRRAGWYMDAEAADQLALVLFQRAGDRAREAQALWSLAQAALTRGDHDEAVRKLLDGLTICRELGDREGQARMLRDLGMSASFRGDYEQAAHYWRDALAIGREPGDRQGEFAALRGLALLQLVAHGDAQAATREIRKLYALSEEIGDQGLRAAVLLDLAQAALMRGSRKRAAEAFDNAYRIYEAQGHRHGQANAAWGIGKVAMERGDHDQAAKRLHRALAIYQEIGDQEGAAKTLLTLAELAMSDHQLEQAEALFGDAYAIYLEMGSVLGQAAALKGLADVAMHAGDRTAACSRLGVALQVLRTVDSPFKLQIRQLVAEYGCAPGGVP